MCGQILRYKKITRRDDFVSGDLSKLKDLKKNLNKCKQVYHYNETNIIKCFFSFICIFINKPFLYCKYFTVGDLFIIWPLFLDLREIKCLFYASEEKKYISGCG